MSAVKENKQLILDLAPEILDQVLVPLGFRRPPRSLIYSRSFPRTKHELSLHFDSSPQYATEARMHLLPSICIRMSEVAKTALEMTGNSHLFGRSNVIIGHQIQNLAPKSERRLWLICDTNSCQFALKEVAALFPRWVEPFLQDYTSPDDLLRQYEAGDKRPIQQHNFFIFVAASYVLRGERAIAAGVLDRHLGKPGLRKVYAKAFDYVA